MTVGELVKYLQSLTNQNAEIGFVDWQGDLLLLKDSDIVEIINLRGRVIYDIFIDGESWGNRVESNMGADT